MVFSSVPFYLDPPSWNQQPGYQPVAGGVGGGGGGGVDAHHLQPLVPPSPDGTRPGGAARPGSMAERARQAKVAQPEPGLKCPRCESTNTKFCYYNNYSLSQPRHFCKTCRRYWTRGGALRSVPVGGGCRRNKRSKSSSSKPSGATSDHRQAGTSASSATSAGAATGVVPSNNLPAPPQLPFMASMHLLPDYSAAASIRLNIAGMQALDSLDFQLGACPSVGQLEQWRLPQVQQYFPFMAGLDPAPPAPPSMGLFPFDSGDGGVADHGAFGGLAGQVHGKPSASGLITQLASVKMEENPRELSLPKQYLGVPGNDQYWVGGGSTGGGSSSGGGWTHLSGFNPPSTSNIL